MTGGDPLAGMEQKDRFDQQLHDLTNALAASRSYAEVLHLRAKTARAAETSVIDALLREIDRANGILQEVRRETYKAGDVLRCASCGYTFVNRRPAGKAARCRRCRSAEIERWRPTP